MSFVFHQVLRNTGSNNIRKLVFTSKKAGGCLIQNTIHSKVMNMSRVVYVRCVDSDDRLQIGFTYPVLEGDSESHTYTAPSRFYNLNRPKDEQVFVCLERLKANITKNLTKKMKRHKKTQAVELDDSGISLPVTLLFHNEEVKLDKTNTDAWVEGATLAISNVIYDIRVNSPTVTMLKLPENIMSGFSIFPRLKLEFSQATDVKYQWYISQKQNAVSADGTQATDISREFVAAANKYPKTLDDNCSCNPASMDNENSAQSANAQNEEANQCADVASCVSENTTREIKSPSESPKQLPKSTEHQVTASIKEIHKPKPIDVTKLKWKPVSTARIFTPDNDCLACYIKLECTPVNGTRSGLTVESISDVTVSPGPGLCPFDTRHLFTEKCTEPPNSLRLMTYNILADLYADSDFSRDHLYPHCPPYALHIDYRKQLILKEIIGYQADILCLQEVDHKVFVNDLHPGLDTYGVDTVFKMKGGQVNEGLVTGFKRDRFRFLASHDSVLSDLLSDDPSCRDSITDRISHNPALMERLVARTTAVQVTVLECLGRNGCVVCVANTHLYFHPDAPHIRLLQMATCLTHLENVVKSYEKQGYTVAVILCGDLNSSPDKGCIELITTKRITSTHEDWRAGDDEQYVAGLSYEHALDFENAIPNCPYTNYIGEFSATLDYIFVDSGIFRPTRVIPQPTHEEITQYTALPSITCPSDHIAQVCEVEFK